MRKIDSRTTPIETLELLEIKSGRFYYMSDYACNVECGGNHPHIEVEEFRIGDKEEVWSYKHDDVVARTVTKSHFKVRGQSLVAGIHTSGMEFSFDVVTLGEAEKAINDFESRRL